MRFDFTKPAFYGIIVLYQYLPVAQLDRVPDSDSDGRRFESCRAGQTCATKKHKSRKSLIYQGLFAFSGQILKYDFRAQKSNKSSTAGTWTGVGLSMICYTKTQEIIKSSLRRYSVKRAHRKVIVFAKMDGKLSFEVIEGVKRMSCVKVLIILYCNTFDSQLLFFFLAITLLL